MPVDVSIIIAAYNASRFIERAIGSAQSQLYGSYEIIVIDDQSTDDTCAVVTGMAARDQRIRIFRQDRNQGPAAARNRGLREAQGEWITILDADDAYLPSRLQALVSTARTAGLDLVADNLLLFDMDAQATAGTAFDWGEGATRPLDLEFLLKNDRIGIGRPLGWIKPMMRRAFLLENGLAYNEALRYSEDFFLYVEVLCKGGKAALLTEPHYLYTTRTGLVSRKRSGTSRTSINPSAVSSSCDVLLSRHDAALSPRHKRLFRQRQADGMNYHVVNQIKGSLHDRDIPAAISHALRNPGVSAFMMRYLAWKLSSRTRPRSLRTP